MSHGIVRALTLQPQGTPSWEDLWFFVPFLVVISTALILFFREKKKGNKNAPLFVGFIGFLLIAMLFLYDPFLLAKSNNLFRAVLSVWLTLFFIILGIPAVKALLYLCTFWKGMNIKNRVYIGIISAAAFSLAFLTLFFAVSG